MDWGGHDHCCIPNLLRLCDRPDKTGCAGNMIVVAIELKAGEENGCASLGVDGEPLEAWFGRQQGLRKALGTCRVCRMKASKEPGVAAGPSVEM
jgi:hypothetical protein